MGPKNGTRIGTEIGTGTGTQDRDLDRDRDQGRDQDRDRDRARGEHSILPGSRLSGLRKLRHSVGCYIIWYFFISYNIKINLLISFWQNLFAFWELTPSLSYYCKVFILIVSDSRRIHMGILGCQMLVSKTAKFYWTRV